MYAYPNPNSGTVNLVLDALPAGDVQWRVYDVLERQVMAGMVAHNGARSTTMLHLPAEAKGLYFLEVQAANKQKVMKLVVR